MGPECYKIDVLYYRNPHLIWVEVLQHDENKIHFEQVGIYGVLPMETYIDNNGTVSTMMSDKWVPAATNAMKNLILNAKEMWFCPTYIDRSTSIFDDNTQKFGDIIVKMNSGQEASVLEALINSQFAMHDECIFHKALSNGSIKTKLNYVATRDIIKKLEKSFKRKDLNKGIWLNALKSQTSVFHMAVDLENSVMSRKLTSEKKNVNTVIQNKIKDFEYCKDINEDSLGRGSTRINSTNTNRTSSGVLLKKLNLLKHVIDPSMINKTTKDVTLENNLKKNAAKEWEEADSFVKNIKVTVEKDKLRITNEPEACVNHIAFGPPGLNPTKIALKTTSTINEDTSEPVLKPKIETYESNIERDRDIFEKVDSEVAFKITNLDIPKMKMNGFPTNHITHLSLPKKTDDDKTKKTPSSLQKKLRLLQQKISVKDMEITGLKNGSTQAKSELDSDDESISDLIEKLNLNNTEYKQDIENKTEFVTLDNIKNNVNPFKNVDGSHSVFVDKLVSPILMVHTKKNNRIQTTTSLTDIPFGSDIHIVLRNMSITKPMTLQTISWHSILRGHSIFLISPHTAGKTMGYLPSVCRLVADNKHISEGFGPSCIIICATSKSVSNVESICKMFLHDVRIFACYAGMNDMTITTSLLNGSDLLICTPCSLVRLIQKDFGVDLRNLSTFVIDDCERSSEVYRDEIKFALLKIKEMLKIRSDKPWKIQYIVVSRIWCDFMSSLAKKAADSVICIGAFQECVLYSKASTSVNFVNIKNKLTAIIDFLKEIDRSKRTVIVCRSDDEVYEVERALTELKYVVFSCDSTMTVHDLYKLDLALGEYEEPVLGPILVCCDGNLTHLNVTNAHHLIHYSLPELFSMFCKRFSVLNDNYPSIFSNDDGKVKIKILLDDTNIEQLPKILNFIKRCTHDIPDILDNISQRVLVEKDLMKAQAFVPICANLLASGTCPDLWNCNERHGIFKQFDTPKDWMPDSGIITFQILHYHTAISYSARLLSNISKDSTKKYPQNYSLLSFKMGLYFSKESNKKLHGVPVVGDICAVALKLNLFERCQVMKILTYSRKGTPELVLIKLIDEEIYERTKDVYLYHLPDELKQVETHVIRVVLCGIQPEDRDVTFSELAKNQIKKVTAKDEDLYMRGQVALVIGNVVFVDTLEACQDLSSLNEIIVKHDLKRNLLDGHAIPNPDHISTLQKLCSDISPTREEVKIIKISKTIKMLPKGRWAHFDSDDFMSVFYAYADSPGKFYIRLVKFKDCINMLLSDIKKYVADSPEPLEDVHVGDIVIAKFPDDNTYERARIDNIIDDNKVECFFVDQGDLKEVYIKDLLPITEKFITHLPYQAIECSLVGIKPPGDEWTEFSTNWFIDNCFDLDGKLKILFAKYFTKEKAETTGGNKYNIVLIDTYSETDVIVNQLMIDLNLAQENDDIGFLDEISFIREELQISEDDVDEISETKLKQNQAIEKVPSINNILLEKPIRSVPLVESDSESSTSWSINMPEEFMPMFDIKPTSQPNSEHCDPNVVILGMLPPPKASSALESDNLSPTSSLKSELSSKLQADLSKPKLCWKQNKTNVTIKINLIGVENYEMLISERYLKFFCVLNDVKYGFEFELYGGVDCDKSSHSSKGQYILISLCKIMKRNWLTLTKATESRKWIIYDLDDIDTSSDEEPVDSNCIKEIVKNSMDDLDTDSDEEFHDDANFKYK